MAEYLSPGVYMEEFDSGIKAMEGVGTSTAGFVGMAVKGPVKGMPVLITSFADYQRRFGGYLSERLYGKWRFMPYAVEQFFANGGSTCYCMRVCEEAAAATGTLGTIIESDTEGKKQKGPGEVTEGQPEEVTEGQPVEGEKPKKNEGDQPEAGKGDQPGQEGGGDQPEAGGGDQPGQEGGGDQPEAGGGDQPGQEGGGEDPKEPAKEKSFLTVTAANPGSWGNKLVFTLTRNLKSKTGFVVEESKDTNQAVKADAEKEEAVIYKVKDAGGLQAGDMVVIQAAKSNETVFCYNIIKEVKPDNSISLEWNLDEGATIENNSTLTLVEWNLSASDDTAVEQYESVSFNQNRSNYLPDVVTQSQLFTVALNKEALTKDLFSSLVTVNGEEPFFQVTFSGGTDPAITDDNMAGIYIGKDGAPGERTGIKSFLTLSDVSIMAVPGVTDVSVQSELVTHCEGLANRFAILDMPLEDKEVSKLQEFRESFDTSYAAMYHPWIKCYDMLSRKNSYFPPSGAMAGIYARTDNSRGVHKAPANEVVRSCTGLSVNYNDGEQGKLNPKGINLIRSLPGQGIRVWGARTCSSDGNWKYINVRRLFIYIEQSIKTSTGWAVFEPNDEMLWSRVEGTIRVFLTSQWRNGALAGSTADEAFFVNIGKSTMTQDDILNGRLICVIGVAPVRPAEFVIFRITQKMETAQ